MRILLIILLFFITDFACCQEFEDSVYSVLITDIEREMDGPDQQWIKTQDLFDILGTSFVSYLHEIGINSFSGDSTIDEAYRLIIWGGINKYIITINRLNEREYQVMCDSISKDCERVYRDTMVIFDVSSFKVLREQCMHLFSENMEEETDPDMFDDRDVWMLEFVIQKQYKAIIRRHPDDRIKELMYKIVTIGEFAPVRFYFDL